MMSGRILLGIGLLFFGRQLFWLFVAVMGFLLGLDWIAPLLPSYPSWVGLLIAAGIGVVGALLVVLWQWVAVGVAGFLAGGYLVGQLLPATGVGTGTVPWGLFLLGGFIGSILMIAVFDWALIVLSALSGATVIVQALPFERLPAVGIFVGLTAVGIMVQARRWRSPPSQPLT
jgi:Domain of unknown function (DUF4203)